MSGESNDGILLTQNELKIVLKYFDKYKNRDSLLIDSKLIPLIMQYSGQNPTKLEIVEIKEISDNLTDGLGLISCDTFLEIIKRFWHTQANIEAKLKDAFLALLFHDEKESSGVLIYNKQFEKNLVEYGEPFDSKELKSLLKFLFPKKAQKKKAIDRKESNQNKNNQDQQLANLESVLDRLKFKKLNSEKKPILSKVKQIKLSKIQQKLQKIKNKMNKSR